MKIRIGEGDCAVDITLIPLRDGKHAQLKMKQSNGPFELAINLDEGAVVWLSNMADNVGQILVAERARRQQQFATAPVLSPEKR